MADRQRRLLRIYMDRRNIHGELRRGLRDQEAHDAVRLHPECGAEREGDPRAIDADLELVSFGVDSKACGAAVLAGTHAKRNTQRGAPLDEDVVRPFDGALEVLPATLERILAAAGITGIFRSRRELREATLCALQVRRTHRGKKLAIEVFRRKGNGDAKNRALDVVVSEDLPKRLALPAQLGRRT